MDIKKLKLPILIAASFLTLSSASLVAVSHFQKINLKYKFEQAKTYINDSLKIMRISENPRLFQNYLKRPQTFENDFFENINLDHSIPPLPIKYYSKTYLNKSKNNSINADILGYSNFTAKNKITYFIKNENGAIYLSVDLNSYKQGPNVWGEDLFTFQVLEDGKAYAMGDNLTDYSKEKYKSLCSSTSYSTYNGITCSSEAEENKKYFDF